MLKTTDTHHLKPHSIIITRQFFRAELHFRAVRLIRNCSRSPLSNTTAKCHLSFFLGLLLLQCIDKFNIVPTSFLKFCLIKVSHHPGTHYLSFRSCSICMTKFSYLVLPHQFQRHLRFTLSADLCINSNMVADLIMQNTGWRLGRATRQDIAFLQKLQEIFHCSTGKGRCQHLQPLWWALRHWEPGRNTWDPNLQAPTTQLFAERYFSKWFRAARNLHLQKCREIQNVPGEPHVPPWSVIKLSLHRTF